MLPSDFNQCFMSKINRQETMKKIYYIIMAMFILMASCADLEEYPIGVLTPESYFQNEGDLNSAILGLYNAQTAASISSENDYYDFMSDEMDVDPTTFRAYRFLFNEFRYTPSDYVSEQYRNQFTRISYANIILSRIDGIDMNDALRDQYRAEALFNRAQSYYELIQMFGDVPYLEETMPDPSDGESLKRTPAEKIYGYIIEDLEWCVDHLPNDWGGIRNRATEGTALTYLASIHLTLATYSEVYANSYEYRSIDDALVESLTGTYATHWDAAAYYALEVINNKGKYGYGLVDDFQDLFNGEVGDTKEHILSVDYNSESRGYYIAGQTHDGWRNQNNGLVPLRKPWDAGGWGAMMPPLSFYESFIEGDYRRDVSFEETYALTTSSVNGDTTSTINYTAFVDQYIKAPGCAKWTRYPGPTIGWPDGSGASFNLAPFRYAEVLLIAAEALNEIGRTDEAIVYVNQLRARARLAGGENRTVPVDVPSGLSQEQCWDTIWQERSYELCFEWKRRNDLVRRDSLMAVMSRFVPAMTGEPLGSQVQNYHKLMCLPQEEIDLTGMVQNAGY